MKDFNNREIKIGDIVAFYSFTYKGMYSGRVYNLGEKMVCVEFTPYTNNPLNIKKYKGYPKECIVLESVLI